MAEIIASGTIERLVRDLGLYVDIHSKAGLNNPIKLKFAVDSLIKKIFEESTEDKYELAQELASDELFLHYPDLRIF